eukprot:832887-Pelagomonas_calceolata.AAC.3
MAAVREESVYACSILLRAKAGSATVFRILEPTGLVQGQSEQGCVHGPRLRGQTAYASFSSILPNQMPGCCALFIFCLWPKVWAASML